MQQGRPVVVLSDAHSFSIRYRIVGDATQGTGYFHAEHLSFSIRYRIVGDATRNQNGGRAPLRPLSVSAIGS